MNRFDAWLFDLDGVITNTASVHDRAWKAMFDAYLKDWSAKNGKPFKEFTGADYHHYVDGKPRYDGVDAFLKSRGIELPWGDPSDGEYEETVCGLGNRKNTAFNTILKEQGVEVFPSTVALIKALRANGNRVAVVTSSKNCTTVLTAANLNGLFEIQLDGNVAAENKFEGKPAPRTYVEAANMLGVPVKKSVVVEDAISGVQAGRAGGFGLVIGIARGGDAEALQKNGADIVVSDLEELGSV